MCIDFPSALVGDWGANFSAPAGGGAVTNTATTGSGVKVCGLQAISGPFQNNSYSDGVVFNQPATQTGNWTLTVSGGKSGGGECVQ